MTNTDRNPREAINHGHNDWSPLLRQWQVKYETWCPSCRAAKAKAARAEFDLDDDEPMPEAWANDMRVKGGKVR